MATEAESGIAAGNGPGEKHVGVRGVIALGVYCILAFFLCGSALVELWPHPTPSGTVPKNDSAAGETGAKPPGASHGGTDGSGTSPVTPPATTGTTTTGTTTTGTTTTGTTTTSTTTTGTTTTGTTTTGTTTTGTIAGRTSTGTTPTTTGTTGTTAAAGKTPLAVSAAEEERLAADEKCASQPSRCASCERAAAALRGSSSVGAQTNDPECVRLWWMWLVLWQEERLLLIVLLAGALGALLHGVTSFTTYTGFRKLVLSWVPWYVLNPFAGAFLAMVFYLTIRGGFFSSNSSVGSTSPFGFAAVAALVGMFSRQATQKLLKTFEAIFTVAPSGTEAMHSPAPKPVLADVSRTVTFAKDSEVALKGSGFMKTSKVHIGNQELPTEWVSETDLKAKVPVTMIPAAGQSLIFTVVTPPPGGGTTEGKAVTVA